MAVAVVPGACRDGFVGLAAYRSRDGLTADRETRLMLTGQGQDGAGAPLATAAGAPLRFAKILEMGRMTSRVSVVASERGSGVASLPTTSIATTCSSPPSPGPTPAPPDSSTTKTTPYVGCSSHTREIRRPRATMAGRWTSKREGVVCARVIITHQGGAGS
jgi:hypothetical protein